MNYLPVVSMKSLLTLKKKVFFATADKVFHILTVSVKSFLPYSVAEKVLSDTALFSVADKVLSSTAYKALSSIADIVTADKVSSLAVNNLLASYIPARNACHHYL